MGALAVAPGIVREDFAACFRGAIVAYDLRSGGLHYGVHRETVSDCGCHVRLGASAGNCQCYFDQLRAQAVAPCVFRDRDLDEAEVATDPTARHRVPDRLAVDGEQSVALALQVVSYGCGGNESGVVNELAL